MKDLPTYYDVLEIPESASQAEAAAAYRRMVKEYHPDRLVGLPEHLKNLRRDAEEKWREIQEAWDILGDPVKRAKYNEALNEFRGQSTSAAPPPKSAAAASSSPPGSHTSAPPPPPHPPLSTTPPVAHKRRRFLGLLAGAIVSVVLGRASAVSYQNLAIYAFAFPLGIYCGVTRDESNAVIWGAWLPVTVMGFLRYTFWSGVSISANFLFMTWIGFLICIGIRKLLSK